MSTWDNFRNSLKYESNQLGIGRFREFSVVNQTMRASYAHVAKDWLTPETESLFRANVTVDGDFENLLNQLMTTRIFQSMSSIDLTKIPSIFEFGGGCGYLCHCLKLLGFTGDYHIYDFPEVHAIQREYLNSVNSFQNVYLVTEPHESDLFIGCWSYSESVPRLPLSDFPSKEYWIAYQSNFDGIDNNSIQSQFKQYKTVPAKHHTESKYMVGWNVNT